MSKTYVKLLNTAEMRVSVTQKGDPYENAPAERVNGEWINGEEYEHFERAQKRIAQIILLYNSRRLHSAIRYKTPDQVHGSTSGNKKNPGHAPRTR